MSKKVAFKATCVTLLLTLCLIFLAAQAAVDQINGARASGLAQICRVSAAVLDTAFLRGEDGTAVAQTVIAGECDYTLFSADHAVLVGTDADTPLTLRGEREYSYESGGTLFAVSHLASGGALRVALPAATLRDLPSRYVRYALLGALAIALIVYALLKAYERKAVRTVTQMTRLVTDFADGEYEHETTVVRGVFREDWDHFAQSVGRIQEQHIRSQSRSNAVTTVLTQMQNGILAVDSEGRILFVTAVAKQLLGMVGNVDGLSLSDAAPGVKLPSAFEAALKQENGVYQTEVVVRSGAGRGHRPIRLYISAVRRDGEPAGALAIVEDITMIRMLEQVRTDFAANVSHELKTPLTSIKGFVETLMNGAVDNHDMAMKFLKIIMLETDRLTRLINDILSISKLESGESAGPNERIDIDKMAADVCEMLKIHAQEKEITVNDSRSAQPAIVVGNPDRVEQMLLNLIENGIKYNKPGGSVSVSVFPNGKEINISIADTGIGIPEEHMDRLFERFYRVDKGRSRSMGGTGLGLAIVKHIVKSMNGMIEVHSKFGEGTEFLITLPAAGNADGRVEAAMEENS